MKKAFAVYMEVEQETTKGAALLARVRVGEFDTSEAAFRCRDANQQLPNVAGPLYDIRAALATMYGNEFNTEFRVHYEG